MTGRTAEILGYLLVNPDLLENSNLKADLFPLGFERQTFLAAKKIKENSGSIDFAELARSEELSQWEDRFSRIAALTDGTHKINEGAFHQKVIMTLKSRAALKLVNATKDAGSLIVKKVDPDFQDLDDAVKEYVKNTDSLSEEADSNLLCFKDISEEEMKWHIPGVYALGMIHSLSGVQGHGKSLHLIDLAARTSTGSVWPITGEKIPKGDVLYITDEDSRDKIIKPRLRLAGADMGRIFIPDFNIENLLLPDDKTKLETWIRKLKNPRILLLDPLADYSLGSLNPSEGATKIIQPLKSLADKTGVCIIYTVHFNKKIDIDSIHRVAHSYVLTSKPRLAWLIIKQDPDDDLNPHRLFCCGKTAFKPIPNMIFTIKGDEFDVPFIDDWRTTKTHTSDALATGERRRDLKVEEAEEFLVINLDGQTMYVDEIMTLAEKENINYKAIYRARRNLPIVDDWNGKRKLWKLKKTKK